MSIARWLPAACVGAGVLLTSGIREQHQMAPRAAMASLPSELGGFHGKDLVVPDDERRIAGMSDYMLRTFGPDSNPAFTTYVGYYEKQVQGKAIHSPKNCLPGAGWEIMTTEQTSLGGTSASNSVNRVLLANKGVLALVYYWYQGRGRIEANEYTVKWNLLRDAATYGRTEEALVRIVVPITSPKKDDLQAIARADSTARRVAADLLPAVERALPPAPGA